MSARVESGPTSAQPPTERGPTRAERVRDAYHKEAVESGLRDIALIKDVWPFLRPQKVWLSVALVCVVLTAGLSLLRPLIMLWTIDGSLASKDPSVMLRGGALFAAVMVAEQLLSFVQIYATQVVGARAMADLRLAVFRFIGQLPLRFFDRQPVGRLVTRVTNDVDSIQELFASGALNALGDLIRLVGVVVLMIGLDWKLSLVSFAALPFIAILVEWVRGRSRLSFREIRGETARMNANMNEQVSGIALVQAYGRQGAMLTQFDQINASYRDANIRSVKYDAIQDATIDALSSISLASIVMALGYHTASFGTVVALTIYLKQFFEPISMLAQRYTLLQAALSGAERVFGLLKLDERDAPPGTAPVRDGDPSWAIEFERVSFGYKPGSEVLHQVSLQARPGDSIALVGPTGSGKTTVTALLLRLYELGSGVIRVGGKDVSGLSRDELRRQFAVVPQDVFLFPGNLAQNIAAGQDPDIVRVQKVLREMGIWDVFARREGGLLAPVEAGGGNYSAGERQLIAFARALYRDAPFVILDEATASIDSETEARMQQAMSKLMEGRTSIIVAHRLSTIRSVSKIVVLQQGHVVEQGTHEELMDHGGLYAALVEFQFSRQDQKPEAPSRQGPVPSPPGEILLG